MSRRHWKNPAAQGKPDSNQPQIVQALEACGWSVQSLTGEGDGVCDLLVGIPEKCGTKLIGPYDERVEERYPPLAILVEVKLPLESKSMKSRPRAKRGLNDKQVAFWQRWHGPKVVARSEDEAVDLVWAYVRTVRDGWHETRDSTRFKQPKPGDELPYEV